MKNRLLDLQTTIFLNTDGYKPTLGYLYLQGSPIGDSPRSICALDRSSNLVGDDVLDYYCVQVV